MPGEARSASVFDSILPRSAFTFSESDLGVGWAWFAFAVDNGRGVGETAVVMAESGSTMATIAMARSATWPRRSPLRFILGSRIASRRPSKVERLAIGRAEAGVGVPPIDWTRASK